MCVLVRERVRMKNDDKRRDARERGRLLDIKTEGGKFFPLPTALSLEGV